MLFFNARYAVNLAKAAGLPREEAERPPALLENRKTDKQMSDISQVGFYCIPKWEGMSLFDSRMPCHFKAMILLRLVDMMRLLSQQFLPTLGLNCVLVGRISIS